MKNKKGFTLIELVVVITIIGIVSVVSYAPYNYYKNKVKLKNSASKITQILYESRNKAINWSVWEYWNVSVGVYFDSNWLKKWEANVFSYPYNYATGSISYIENTDIKKIKTLILDNGVQFDEIEWLDNLLFVFDAITWKVHYYSWNWWVRSIISEDEININISYKWATSRNLKKEISYFTYTNVIDY